MVVVGGLTRLTGSGLSMVEWRPATGFIPPMNATEWQVMFDNYRQFPEFMKINPSMNLEGFKGIFWLEFIHRVLGRLIGLAFLLPFLYFLARRMIPGKLTPRLITMFVLGGMQGLLGWYMVKSGLVNDPHVSQYRLTAHLMLAVVIFSLMLWTALELLQDRKHANQLPVEGATLWRPAMWLALLVALTMTSGGLVAGLKAGLIYNTFPLMGDSLIAPGVYASSPWYMAMFEDAITVQFNHRLLAITTFTLIVIFWLRARACQLSEPSRIALHLMLIMAVVQVALGISTLLLRVPVQLGAAHQAGAMLLLTTAIIVTYTLKTESIGNHTSNRAAFTDNHSTSGLQ
ncbi:MAG TPA: heme A synthase [Gammaproteobacteria bacterium]|nr:heme A synthase [Gammaproteobacteria bacterium]